MNKKICCLLISFLLLSGLYGQNVTVKGVVTDSITGDALPYAELLIQGSTFGTITNGEGQFSLSVPSGKKTLVVSYLGYDSHKIELIPEKTTYLSIPLSPSGIHLEEVIIKPQKEKYRKKDNPAVRLIRKMIERKNLNNPYTQNYFSYEHYENILFAMNEYTPKPSKSGKKNKFGFVEEFVDTLTDGTTILPVSEKERVEMVYYRNHPKSEKHVIKGSQSSGVDEVFSRDGVQQFLGEAFREVDIFKNDIPLFLQRFVSPLSNIGPNYYKYYLLDTLDVAGQPCVDLGFVPFNSETF